MEAVARVRHIRVTPMKARRVVNLIRGKQASEAMAILKFAPQQASDPIFKLVQSAVANAKVIADKQNLSIDEDDLFVSRAFVDEGTTLKRFMPRAQGRAFKILKRTSHITIVVATPDELAGAKASREVVNEAVGTAIADMAGTHAPKQLFLLGIADDVDQ